MMVVQVKKSQRVKYLVQMMTATLQRVVTKLMILYVHRAVIRNCLTLPVR